VPKGNRKPAGNLSETRRKSPARPGTSGGDGQANSDNAQRGPQGNVDLNRPVSPPRRQDEDEDSGLGNRNRM
jgi:hypothetical protein